MDGTSAITNESEAKLMAEEARIMAEIAAEKAARAAAAAETTNPNP